MSRVNSDLTSPRHVVLAVKNNNIMPASPSRRIRLSSTIVNSNTAVVFNFFVVNDFFFLFDDIDLQHGRQKDRSDRRTRVGRSLPSKWRFLFLRVSTSAMSTKIILRFEINPKKRFYFQKFLSNIKKENFWKKKFVLESISHFFFFVNYLEDSYNAKRNFW